MDAMKIALIACLLLTAVSARAQTAEELFDRASVNSLKAYSADGGPAAAGAAIADLDAAIKLKPGYHDAYNLRANVKLEKGDLDGALADYSKAIALSPKTAGYYTNRAKLLVRRKDAKGALADMAKVLALRPKDERAYMDRGEIKMGARDYAGALKDFDKSLALKPDFLPVRRRRAEAYRALGKTALAAEDDRLYKEQSEKFLERFK